MSDDDFEGDPWAGYKPKVVTKAGKTGTRVKPLNGSERRIASSKLRISFHVLPETRDVIYAVAEQYGLQPGEALDAIIREEKIRRKASQ